MSAQGFGGIITVAVCLALSVSADAQHGDPEGGLTPAANGPVRLASPASRGQEPGQEGESPEAVPESRSAGSESDRNDALTLTSPLESLPLGTPNGLLSARPVDEAGQANTQDAAAGSTEGGWLTWIDPRQSGIARTITALAVVLGLIFALRTVVRRSAGLLHGGDRPSGVVEVLARYPIARGQQLIILKLARRVLLLHHAGTTMTALTELHDPDEVAALLARMEAGSGNRGASRFRSMLKRFQTEHDNAASNGSLPSSQGSWGDTVESNELIDLTRRNRRPALSLRGAGSGRRLAG